MSVKLLDYGEQHPFGEIFGKVRYLRWPVQAYRLTLPKASVDGDDLNPFEWVVLKLLHAAGSEDARALAQETRIPLDLVKGILLRLQDKGFIDEYARVINRGLEKIESKGDTVEVYATAIVFREVATGKILPFLHLLDDTKLLKTMGGKKGIFREIRSNDSYMESPPTPRDVISAWRTMKNRSEAFGLEGKIPAVQQITIARSPESYFLVCPIAIQELDGEFRIADPFGNGFSLILERAFERLLEQDDKQSDWLHQWKRSLSNPRPPHPSDSAQCPKEPFENDVNRQRYPKLVDSLLPHNNEQFRSISDIYASLEWALFYTCSRRSFEDAILKLKLTRQSEHINLLQNAARSIGLELHESQFRPVREGKLLDFQNGKAELGTVLAIAILQAQEDQSHPLHRFASSQPDLISRLLGVKRKRDEKAHGKGKAGPSENEFSDDPLMREIVHTLLPDISFLDTPITNDVDKGFRADTLLDARAAIQNEFSFKAFNRLGSNLQNRLIHAERFWLSCEDDYENARSFADDVYAAVQSAFEKRLDGKLPPEINDTEFVSAAEKKTFETGLAAELPKSLRRVKTLAIRQTLQGGGQTLGACAIAFLLMSDDDTLRLIADSQPSFINDIAMILARRGHGNEPLKLPRAEIKMLRKASYSTIKTLIEA